MILRPVDASGDILPVLSAEDLLSGAEAVARLVEYRLNLFSGEWWENPAWGCTLLEQMREPRLTGADAQRISSYLSSYVRETQGVRDVEDVAYTLSDRRFSWSCTVRTEYGDASVSWEFE